ncbi:50S ribosomal protein L18 [Candidatus Woesearchaeota archaeon]|nr:50S ribosomal protein L18 [Candidatus Woesearchaeota archaeon]
MVKKKTQVVIHRRKREQKTNYKKRLALLKSKKNRLVIKIFNKHVLAQLIKYDPKGDIVIGSAYSKELGKLSWDQSLSNTSAAYLTGLLLSQKVKEEEAVLDTGLQRVSKGGKIYACLKGCVDGGLIVPHSEEVLPAENRVKGEHVASYAALTKNKKQFSKLKNTKKIVENFEKTKKNILSKGGK